MGEKNVHRYFPLLPVYIRRMKYEKNEIELFSHTHDDDNDREENETWRSNNNCCAICRVVL
jgi:hypothetical protein